eukprot:956201-Amphidinium_carterae.1
MSFEEQHTSNCLPTAIGNDDPLLITLHHRLLARIAARTSPPTRQPDVCKHALQSKQQRKQRLYSLRKALLGSVLYDHKELSPNWARCQMFHPFCADCSHDALLRRRTCKMLTYITGEPYLEGQAAVANLL